MNLACALYFVEQFGLYPSIRSIYSVTTAFKLTCNIDQMVREWMLLRALFVCGALGLDYTVRCELVEASVSLLLDSN